MTRTFSEKAAIGTDAGGGIASAVAVRVAERGAPVIVNDIDPDAAVVTVDRGLVSQQRAPRVALFFFDQFPSASKLTAGGLKS